MFLNVPQNQKPDKHFHGDQNVISKATTEPIK